MRTDGINKRQPVMERSNFEPWQNIEKNSAAESNPVVFFQLKIRNTDFANTKQPSQKKQ